MEKRQAIKFLSYNRVKKVLNSNPAAVGSTVLLTNSKAAFDTKLTVLSEIEVPEVDATIPTTDQKNEAMDSLALDLLLLCDGVAIYAKDTGDSVLAGKLPANITAMLTGNEVTVVKRFSTIIKAIKALPAVDIAPYGVDSTELDALETQLTALEGMVGSPRSLIDARVLVRDSEQKAYQDMDDFLSSTLDRAVRNRTAKYPAFVEAYFAARKLHDMPSGSVQEELKKLNTENALLSTTALKEALAPVEMAAAPPVSSNGVHV